MPFGLPGDNGAILTFIPLAQHFRPD